FGKSVADYYSIDRLDPAYRVYFGTNDYLDIASDIDKIKAEFERLEPGAAKKLDQFMNNARQNYEIAIHDIVYRPGESIGELISLKTIKRLPLFFKTISGQVRSLFKHPKIIKILEFPVLFLGAKPRNTPAFYNFMNFADFGMGTWFPKNGMYDIIQGMVNLAETQGVTFKTNAKVSSISVKNNQISGLVVNDTFTPFDLVVSGADYHHTEQLLENPYRMYSEKYWDKRVLAPSCLLFFVGFDKKLDRVEHHNLFFDTDFEAHATSIYDRPEWPENPLFYANFTSLTNPSTAPDGCENGFFLIPIAPGIEDSEDLRKHYFELIIERFEQLTQQKVREHVLFAESFGIKDFVSQYHSYKGNAYGLANILTQTAFLRPKLRSKKVKGLFFTGQLTVPGPGVPPSLISGKLSAELVLKSLQ
ncbi:MAG: phytoene desaturase family protein, partial [Flavobacteriaceae bacterium]|nr:phytoene desaturase family protein [Flavobacteriaceae bacterium]